MHTSSFETLEKDEINSDKGHLRMRRLGMGVEDEKGLDKWNEELSPNCHTFCLTASEASSFLVLE